MGNDLRQRLEALMRQSRNFMKRMAGGGSYKASYVACIRLDFLEALETAYENRELVTRSEMEEAVAKAVAKEREAMTGDTAKLLQQWFIKGVATEKMQDAPFVAAHARSEQKEGE